MALDRSGAVRLLMALAVAVAGGAIFAALGLPAAWLSGAMAGAALAALSGLKADFPAPLRTAIYFVLGLSLGAGMSPDVVSAMGRWPLSLAGLGLTVFCVTAGSYLFLSRVCRWDPASAYFASIPGALSMTMIVAEMSRADVPRVALSQTLRLFMLVAVLPVVVGTFNSVGGVTAYETMDLPAMALLALLGAAGSFLAEKIRMPAGILLGAFAVSGLMHATGLVPGLLPDWLQLPALVGVGAILGLRFSGVGWRALVATLAAGLGAFLVALSIALAGALAVAALTDLPVETLLVAFAPGGLEAMVVLAFVLKVDTAFVAVHHLARFLAMSSLVGVGARLFLGAGWSDRPKGE